MRSPSPSLRIFRFGVFELQPASGELRRNGIKIKLQKQPLGILTMLLERPGEVVSREECRERLWPGKTFVDFDIGVNKAVRKVREALGDSAQTQRYIETLPQHGYRFIAPVTEVGLDTRARRPIAFYAAGAAGFVVVLLLAYWAGSLRRGVPPAEIKAVAVLPLQNLSGDVEQEYFSDGVTEALITELGKIGALRVISRQSVIQYKGVKKPLSEISRELDVNAVLEGTVQRVGDRVRITAQLVQVKPERHLWAENYERRYIDILTLQGEIARDAARQIKARLTTDQETHLARTRPVNPEAYEAFLRGKHLFYGYTPERVRKAIENYDTAIEKDSQFALAWAALAPAYGWLVYWGHARPSDVAPKVRAAAWKAIELDDTLAEGHSSLGYYAASSEYDWATAERQLKRAIELNPNYAIARGGYGMVLASFRRTEEAMEQFRIGRGLDPLHPNWTCVVGWCYYISGQYEKAVAQLRQAVEMAPDAFINHWHLWRVLHRTGDDVGALQECKRMFELLKDADVVQALDRGERRSGYPGAMREAAQTLARRSKSAYVSAVQAALLFAHAGENDRALEWLEKAYKERDPRLHTVWAEPDWEALYSRPRFQQLLLNMSFPSVEKAVTWSPPTLMGE